jgi:hypothetical protein
MSKTQKKTPAKKPTPKTVSVPPLVAALAKFTEPERDGIPDEFLAAWEAVPGIARAYTNGDDGKLRVSDRHAFIDGAIAEAIACSRRATDHHPKLLAQAVDVLNAANEDYFAEIRVAVSDPAFAVGVALGIYLSLNGGGVR